LNKSVMVARSSLLKEDDASSISFANIGQPTSIVPADYLHEESVTDQFKWKHEHRDSLSSSNNPLYLPQPAG
jgi:hypothetical protein